MPRTDWLDRNALYTPDAPGLVWGPTGETYTYAELHRAGERLAAGLAAQYDLSAGDRVAVLAENTLEHVLLFCAAQKAGYVLVPLNFRLAPPELQYLVDDSAPHVLFASADFRDIAEGLELDAPVAPLDKVGALMESASGTADTDSPELDDPLMILYTSGTTGRPKGTIIPHKMLFWNSVNTELRLDLTAQDRSFNAAPFYHTGGWNVLLTPFLHHGATTYLFPSFDPGAILRTCDEEALTILWGVPTMLKMMADHAAFDEVTLDTVRYAVVGGEAMPEPLIRTWQDKGVPIRQGFGMTEVGVNCFPLPARDALRKIGSIGFPNFYVDAKVVDENGENVPPNTTGELLLRGPVVTPGYWRNPKATDAAIDEMLQLANKRDKNAIKILGKMGATEAVETLVEYADADSDPELQKVTFRALGEIGDKEAVQPLANKLLMDNDNVRPQAARALGLLGDTRAIRPLSEALKADEESNVRAQAAWALRQIGTKRALEAVVDHGSDDTFIVQTEIDKARRGLDAAVPSA